MKRNKKVREIYLKHIVKKFHIRYKYKSYKKHVIKFHKIMYNLICLGFLVDYLFDIKQLGKISAMPIFMIGVVSFIMVVILDIILLLLTYKPDNNNYRMSAFSYYVSLRWHGKISEIELSYLLEYDDLE